MLRSTQGICGIYVPLLQMEAVVDKRGQRKRKLGSLADIISALKFEMLWMIWSRGVRSEGPTLLWPGLSRGIFLPRSFAQTGWCRDLKAYFLRPRVIHLFNTSSVGVWISLILLLSSWVSHYTKPGGAWVTAGKSVPASRLFTP